MSGLSVLFCKFSLICFGIFTLYLVFSFVGGERKKKGEKEKGGGGGMVLKMELISFYLCTYGPKLLQVLALDKRYLDPRRSVNPTQAEKEEGIIPLTDSLPIIPQVCWPCHCLITGCIQLPNV